MNRNVCIKFHYIDMIICCMCMPVKERKGILLVMFETNQNINIDGGVFGKLVPYLEQNFPAMTMLKVFYRINGRLLQEYFSE